VDEEKVATGNGAAELIRVLCSRLHGKIGVIYPSFNEYEQSFGAEAVVQPFHPRNTPDDFSYGADDVISWLGECDALILINPDNPSGNYIPHADMLRVLDYAKGAGKQVIVDESFIDFADEEAEKSLFTDDIFQKYPNMVLVKSLSKSFGVPGLRLGVLGSGNVALVESVRKALPIWNINSFAEFFLQIIGKYKREYNESCASIAAERKRFGTKLAQTGLFTVHPSQANYFLCRCKGFSAKHLASHMLNSQNILIKDLTGKKGIVDDAFVRIAIRSEMDDDRLLEKLPEAVMKIKDSF
jgi:histidinol-phosphate/aromatic aminotransferase/cobyric acid decarboxylase-like protein